MSGDVIEAVGCVTNEGRADLFSVRVELGGRPHVVLARRSGKLDRNHIRCIVGDRVRVEISPYDTSRGRIVHRFKPGEDES
jgi:translation initiation factor IF-1